AIEPVGIPHDTGFQCARCNASSEAVCKDGMGYCLLYISGDLVCCEQLFSKCCREFGVMFCAIVLDCASQIVHERCYTYYEEVRAFLPGNMLGKRIYSVYVIPSMGWIVDSCKTFFNLSIDICEYLLFRLRCLHA